MKNKLPIAVIIIIGFLIAGFIIYTNNILLPIKLKAKIIQGLEENLEKDVQIERLHYNLFRGLIVENITIFDKTKDKLFFSAKEISVNFLIFPLLQKKLIIPLVRIDSPEACLTLRRDNSLNVTDIVKKWQDKKEEPLFSIFVYKIDLFNGKLKFEDEHTDPAFTKEVVDLKVGANIDLPSQIKFLLQGKINNIQQKPSFLSASGEYNFLTQELQCRTKLANIIINEYLLYLKKLPLSLSRGTVDNADFNFNLKNKQLYLEGKASNKNLELRKEKFVLSGDIDIEPNIKYDLENRQFDYKAAFGISNAVFSGLDYFKEISGIKGKINLEKNKVWSDDLKVKLLGSDLNINGAVLDLSKFSLKLNISSNQIDLEKLASLLPNLPKDLSIAGNSTLNLELEGNLRKLPLEIKATSEIFSAKVKLPFLKEPLNDVKGLIRFSLNQLSWDKLSFIYKQTEYNSSCSIVDFNQPNIDCNITSKELVLKTNAQIRDKIINIKNCSGAYLNSDFLMKGKVNIQDNTKPLWNIELESNFAVKDALGLLPINVSDNLKKMKLAGFCKIIGLLSGSAEDLRNWNSQFKISSPSISIYNLKLESLYANLIQKDKLLSINDLTAKLYGGNLNIRYSLNLEPQEPLYSSKIQLSNIDLAKLKLDTQLKDKDICGLLNSTVSLNAAAKTIETLKGQGTLTVKDGRLWELNLFKGLGEFLFIPIYQKIVFKDGDANFIIKNKTVEIIDSFLESEQVRLAGNGKVGFDGSLDLKLHSEFDRDLISNSPDLRKITSAVLGNILVIKIGGTTQKPEYKIIPSTKELIKQIKGFFLGK